MRHYERVTFDDLAAAMRRFDDAVQQRDRVAADEVLDEDYALVLVHPAAALMPRARWLQVLNDYVVHSYTVEEQHIDQVDDVAAVLSRVRMQATVLGEDRSGLFVLTDVWRRREGGWRIWRRHSSPLSAGEMPGSLAPLGMTHPGRSGTTIGRLMPTNWGARHSVATSGPRLSSVGSGVPDVLFVAD